DKEGPGRDQTGDIVHFGPFQDVRYVVVDAVRQAEDRVAKGVERPADHSHLDARLESAREDGAGAATRNTHAADALPVEVAARCNQVNGAHDIVYTPADHRLAE